LLRSAAWSGAGAVIVCATLGIVAVAICWLPVSGQSGRTHSALAAGLLTYLAGLHGGVTVDGMHSSWLPLGMTLIVAFVAWRVGTHLAEAAEAAEVDEVRTLVRAGLAQAATFTVLSMVAVHFATLGTSHASYLGVGFFGFVLFLATGGVSFARSSALRTAIAERLPAQTATVLRTAAAGLLVYVAASAVLVAASLVWHAGRVTELTGELGGGWGSLPILILSLLAIPNAVVGGASYLAGPGITVGPAHASAFGTAHGVLPTFPLLGALPDGHGAGIPVLVLMALTPLLAGVVTARCLTRSERGLGEQLLLACCAAAAGGIIAALAAVLSGGGIGAKNLAHVGAPAGWLGLLIAAALAASSLTALGVTALWGQVKHTVGAEAIVLEPLAHLVVADEEPNETSDKDAESDAMGRASGQ
jgi:hypothetical protein